MKKGVLILLLILLVACKPAKEFPVGTFQPSTMVDKDPIRPPEIDRVETPEEEEEFPEPPKKRLVDDLSYEIEAYDLRVSYGEIIGVDQSLGQTPILFTKYQFPDLLRSRNIRGGIEPIGGTYEQYLKLIGGKTTFTSNEEDRVGDYLVYEDEEPIFEYQLQFRDGSFLDFLDEEIWILNNPYFIKDATKKDVVLEHVENGDVVVIGAGPIMINQETLQNTDSRMTGDSLFIVAQASAVIDGDDIFVQPGHSLQEYLGEPNMVTDLLDIYYEGVSVVPISEFFFKNIGKEIELRAINPYGYTSRIPLAFKTDNGWRLGDEEGVMYVSESDNETDYKVNIDDYVVLTSPGTTKNKLHRRHLENVTGPLSIVLQYKKINTREGSVEFTSREGTVIEAFYGGKPGSNAEGTIYFGTTGFSFRIGNATDGYPIAIDLNGDDRFTGSIVDIGIDDAFIDMPSREIFNGPANLTLTLLNFEVLGIKEEVTTIQINPEKELSLTVYADYDIQNADQGDNKEALTDFGTYYSFLDQKGKNTFEGIRIHHPLHQRYAQIRLEAK